MKLDSIQPTDSKIFPETEIFLPPAAQGDRLIRINISRNTLLAFVFSILFHAVLLMLVIPKIEFDQPQATAPTTIEVSLAPVTPPAPSAPSVPEIIPEVPPEPAKPPPKVKPALPKPPKVMTQPKSITNPPVFSVPDVAEVPKPAPAPAPSKPQENTPLPTDMLAYVKARQAARQSTESDAARLNAEAAAKERGPSEEELRDQRIAKNLTGGAGGTFTLNSLDSRRASFSFNGWVNSLSNTKRQYFEVEATSGQDVRLLMVRRIISFIRESYQGDFPWDSHRLGKVVTLSARPEDNAALEEFLMVEFFGANYRLS
jgi:outer membrane biosynthesis protein TonB